MRALKTALAVGIAWFLAPLMPGVADDYPYYAPLGALISMHPTLMRSAKNGLQTLAGLAIGILLAWIVILLGESNLVTISLVVGAGVLISGIRWLGAGGDYVPIAALFVLILGGPDADDFSVGYLVQTSLGIVVGLAVNLLIFPPLTFGAAAQRLSRLRSSLAKHLDEIGEALTESWPPEHEDWATRGQTLAVTAAEVRAAVHDADDSRKGNPRARIHRRNLAADYADLTILENVTFYVRDLTEVLAGAVWGKPIPLALAPELRHPLSSALQAAAALLRAWDDGGAARDAFDAADDALRALTSRLAERHNEKTEPWGPAATIAMDLTRILAALRPRVEGIGEDT